MAVTQTLNALETLFSRYRDLIPEWPEFLAALNRRVRRSLRVNTLKISVPDLISGLESRGFSLKPTGLRPYIWELDPPGAPGALPEYHLGCVHAQTLTSLLPVIALDLAPGMLVLDLCAAPGSKTSQAAQEMGDKGLIIANEPARPRLGVLRQNLTRLGVTAAVPTNYAGEFFPLRYDGHFDRVLVDAPCSGEGNFRRDAQSRITGRTRQRPGLPELQLRLLTRAFDLMRPDGALIYSTCTYAPEENELVVQELLTSRPARLLPLNLPGGFPGLTKWQEKELHADLSLTRRFYPHRCGDAVGFFLAKVARA